MPTITANEYLIRPHYKAEMQCCSWPKQGSFLNKACMNFLGDFLYITIKNIYLGTMKNRIKEHTNYCFFLQQINQAMMYAVLCIVCGPSIHPSTYPPTWTSIYLCIHPPNHTVHLPMTTSNFLSTHLFCHPVDFLNRFFGWQFHMWLYMFDFFIFRN